MKTYKFACNKLVRDKTIERMNAKNMHCHFHIANEEKYLAGLKEKLIEEALEVKDAKNRTELIDEMVDVLEVLHALCKASNISLEEVEKKQHETRNLRGGFTEKIYLEYFELAQDNPLVADFKSRSDKYPEIE